MLILFGKRCSTPLTSLRFQMMDFTLKYSKNNDFFGLFIFESQKRRFQRFSRHLTSLFKTSALKELLNVNI